MDSEESIVDASVRVGDMQDVAATLMPRPKLPKTFLHCADSSYGVFLGSESHATACRELDNALGIRFQLS